jgi:hypothetical protein
MPELSAEQRAIIARLGAISARFDDAIAQAAAAQIAAGQNILNVGTRLVTAMNSLQEIVTLQREYGDALRELLDTYQ